MTKYTAKNQDILREIGNIGGGHAVTSLSQMLNSELDLAVPECKIVAQHSVKDLVVNPLSLYAGVSMHLEGNMDFVLALLLNKEFSGFIVEKLTGEPLTDVEHMDDMQKSVICEIGNIMCNSYVTAFAALMNKEIQVSVPYMKVDTGEKVVADFMQQSPSTAQDMLFVSNTFFQKDKKMASYILFHPTDTSLQDILAHLG